MVLVLDDVHELVEPQALRGIEFLVRHAPPQLRLVLSTRADPPLPLHRLLVSGRLAQVRGADLAFTVAEVAELLAEYDYRPGLSDDDIAVLQARTEGWAAGLRLAAVSMQHQPDRHRFVTELAGDDRSLAGYLVSEVLERQPAELRSFLLRTCVVDQLSGELADALTGRDDGERTLARLERANAFVVTLGSRREWYRYHPLFAELLRYELRREAPHEITGLHRRAARWYAGRGLPADAIQQAAAVHDWGYVAELACEHGLGLVLHGERHAFGDLLDRLPADVVNLHPELGLLRAAERIAAADDATEAALQLAREREHLLADDRRPRFGLVLAICRLLRAGRAGDLGRGAGRRSCGTRGAPAAWRRRRPGRGGRRRPGGGALGPRHGRAVDRRPGRRRGAPAGRSCGGPGVRARRRPTRLPEHAGAGAGDRGTAQPRRPDRGGRRRAGRPACRGRGPGRRCAARAGVGPLPAR